MATTDRSDQADQADRTDQKRALPGRGTLLNTATVLVGALIGLVLGQVIPESYQSIVMGGIGLATFAIGIKMFLDSKNVLIVIASIVLGGVIGLALGIHAGVDAFSRWAQEYFGAGSSSTFAEAVLTTSVLFCVGPLTLLGCMQDALEGKIELLAVKSLMDGFAAIIFAAALGPGVLVTAGVVLVFQGLLTLFASPLRRVLHDDRAIAEATAVGGVMLMMIGLNLVQARLGRFGEADIPTANYLPGLLFAPLLSSLFRVRAKDKIEPAQ